MTKLLKKGKWNNVFYKYHVCFLFLCFRVDIQSVSCFACYFSGLSCSEGKEEDFNKESLLQLSSLNKVSVYYVVYKMFLFLTMFQVNIAEMF